ncbi:uncharacterized protein B0P05DRAFT_522397 [Gilbertella persicaria]|uniref:uncharacterized protein n=1 Tax=Gilbertella persicaria TaxID=101096 RepID=UPI002220E3BE|nr:uncharacterized protein B0P05DRAFT_522397 [Gilbertella persicaria]KAI8097868.1 hypothetical protein B0P05DRAFT_522397 [Gilbertella persicaria]
MKFLLATLILFFALVQALTNCTTEQWSYCGQFLASGGLYCQRNNQTLCCHKNMEANDKDYCFSNATYNCRTFISRYGYLCTSNDCVNSNNII